MTAPGRVTGRRGRESHDPRPHQRRTGAAGRAAHHARITPRFAQIAALVSLTACPCLLLPLEQWIAVASRHHSGVPAGMPAGTLARMPVWPTPMRRPAANRPGPASVETDG